MTRLSRTIVTRSAPERVWPFLSDLTTTEIWDPATVRCHRVSGDGGVGTVYENTSRFRDRETRLRYEVTVFDEQRHYGLRGSNKTVRSTEDMVLSRTAAGGTRIDYDAEFVFLLLARLATPFLGAAFTKLGDDAETGMTRALDEL